MNLGEMNREQLMYFLEVAQPDMHELEKLNSEMLQEKKKYYIRNAARASMPKHISGGKIFGAFIASLGIAILFYIIATIIHFYEYLRSPTTPILLSTPSDLLASGFWFLIPFLVSLTIIIVITNLVIIAKRRKAMREIEKEKQIIKEVITQYTERMKVIHSNHPEWRMIPESYQSATVLYGIYNYLRDMRASNWKEAANLYELEHPGRRKPNYEYQIY